MQLIVFRRRIRATLRRHANTLLALCVCVTPAVAGVLPEDRTDALYHRYEGGGLTVQGPSILIQKKITDNFALTANYYEDMISSASIDVKLAASPYKEKRTQKSAGFEYLHGKATYSAGLINSVEPDYKSNTTYYSVSQDMFGDLTTLSMTYKRGWDHVYKDEKLTDGQIVNQPGFGGTDKDGNPINFKDADHRGYAVGLSQILTRNMILSLNYEVLTDQGYLQSPYREVLFLDPTQGLGYGKADQIYPNTRTSNAASAQVKYFLPYRAAISAQYRYFQDTWGIRGHTAELGYTHPAFHHWIFDVTGRFYTQTAATFYSDIFPRSDFQNFEARDRELAAFNSYTAGIGASYEFTIPRAPWINKSSANIRLDHLLIDYKDFRNALLIDPTRGVLAGEEPLYTLNANILQVFVSIWF